MKKMILGVIIILIIAFPVHTFSKTKTTLRLGMVLEPPHLDPTASAAAAIDEVVYANVFEGLTRIDRNGEVKSGLAKSWEISPDKKTYTFHLRENVTFHNGSVFDADDVVYTINRARGESSVNAQKALFAPIDTVVRKDALTVEISLKNVTGSFLFNMGWGDAVIVDPASARSNKSNPIGTGPFTFDRWIKGDQVSLKKNPNYWGKPVSLDKVFFKVIPDPSAAFAAMRAGDIDAFPNFPAPESIDQFKRQSEFAVVIGSTEGETILSTNNKSGPFAKLKVRQAVAHAIDRQAIIDGAMFGYGTPIGTHFSPHHPAYVDLTDAYSFDLKKAKKLMKAAGYERGFKAVIKLPPTPYARRSGEIIASQLKKIGIRLEIVPVEWAQWLEQVFRQKNYDLTIVSHTEPMDIGIYARSDYYFNYDNPELQELISKLDTTVETGERYALMREAQRIISNDCVNGFLFQLAKHGVWNSKIKGLWANSPIQANDLTEVYWAD